MEASPYSSEDMMEISKLVRRRAEVVLYTWRTLCSYPWCTSRCRSSSTAISGRLLEHQGRTRQPYLLCWLLNTLRPPGSAKYLDWHFINSCVGNRAQKLYICCYSRRLNVGIPFRTFGVSFLQSSFGALTCGRPSILSGNHQITEHLHILPKSQDRVQDCRYVQNAIVVVVIEPDPPVVSKPHISPDF